MPAPETFPLELLPATISAVKSNDSILIRCPFDTWGNKGWFFHQLNKAASEHWLGDDVQFGHPQCRGSSGPGQQGVGPLDHSLQIEAAGKVEGQLVEGHLPPTLPRSRPRPRVGVAFTGRTPKCDA